MPGEHDVGVGYFAPPIEAMPVRNVPAPASADRGRGGRAVGATLRSLDDVPAFVLVAATVVLLTGVAAGWLGAMLLAVAHAVAGVAGPFGVPSPGSNDGLPLKGLLLVLNGAANLGLAYQLVRGWGPARWAVSGLCVWWLLFWLYQAAQAQRLTWALGSFPSGRFTLVGVLGDVGALLPAVLAAGTVVVLWMSSSSPHFARR